MNRRQILKGFAAGVAGLMVPAGVADVAEEVSRRYWSLGAIPDDGWRWEFARWVEAMEPRQYPITDVLLPQYPELNRPYDQVTYEWGQSYYPLPNGQGVTIYGSVPYSDRVLTMPRREVLTNEQA